MRLRKIGVNGTIGRYRRSIASTPHKPYDTAMQTLRTLQEPFHTHMANVLQQGGWLLRDSTPGANPFIWFLYNQHGNPTGSFFPSQTLKRWERLGLLKRDGYRMVAGHYDTSQSSISTVLPANS